MIRSSASKLREKTIDELNSMLFSSLDEQFKFRIQSSSSEQKVHPHLVKETRRSIARIKTILNEKQSQSVVNVKVGG
jgi:large subunit ribosomal protein L29